MKFFDSLWVLVDMLPSDNQAMDLSSIETLPAPSASQENSLKPVVTENFTTNYPNIINLLDYLKVRKAAY